MMRYQKRGCLFFLILCVVVTAMGPIQPQASTRFSYMPKYLKSVTYFSDEWPINFWNSESRHMDEEMKRIAADGFNSIILVLPWREFQPTMSPCTYNQYAWDKLTRVMETAHSNGLWVSLRVGYTWDYYTGEDVTVRYEQLLYEPVVYSAWLSYVEKIYQTVSGYENLYGGFLTWEDFWNVTHKVSGTMNQYDRSRFAETYGYADYLRKHYSLEQLTELYQIDVRRYEQAYLPRYDQPAMKLFYEFYDGFLNQLLLDSQQVFPGLSMEVRLDGEPLQDTDGNTYYYKHYDTYACEGADYTAAMYSVSMGQQNNYEKLDASWAIACAVTMLNDVLANNGGKKLYLEQYLFMDTTSQFAFNAQIKEEQRNDFIIGMVPILKSRIMGYGLWVYQNYGNNLIYNPQFAVGAAGWQWLGGSQVVERDGTPMAMILSGGQIKQRLVGRISARSREPIYVTFTADSDAPCQVTVSVGSATQTVYVNGKSSHSLTFQSNGNVDLSFISSGQVYIDDVKAYTYVQDGQIYDMDGNALPCLEAIRTMNSQLN